MHVFVTGASGYVASAVVPELVSAGHTVIGLARSDHAAGVVEARGAVVLRGDLDDLDLLRQAAAEADGVIHLGFKHDEQRSGDLAAAVAADLEAIRAMGSVLVGSGKPFVGTNATGALALAGFAGQLTEDDALPGGPRVEAENAVIALADEGVRSAVVRLPPAVHGMGRYGFVSGLVEVARTSGRAGYLGDGSNRWPSADVRDVARLYRLAFESASAGSRLHAVAEEGIAIGVVADAIGRILHVPVTPIAADEAEPHFGYLTPFVGLDNPTSSGITRALLGWAPDEPGLIDDLEHDRALAGAPDEPVGWTADQIGRLDAAQELEIASRRPDGTLRGWVPIWVVSVGSDAYVRTWHRRDTGWFGHVLASPHARVRVRGLEADVIVADVGEASDALRSDIDEAYRSKYGSGGVERMTSAEAAATTLRLRPERR